MATSWFVYTGGDNSNPQNYSAVGGTPSCPNPNQQLCAIFAEVILVNGIDRPVITGPLQSEINTAVSTLTESSNVRLLPN